MGEVIQFVPKSERERLRLIREARALYESVFPSVEPINKPRDKAQGNQTVSEGNVRRGDGVLS